MFIVSAGMPRSGSTWLYNVIRLTMTLSKDYSDQLICGWVDDIELNTPNVLVKVHNYDPSLTHRADLIFYSYRDLRDAMASAWRKFGRVPSLAQADYLITQDRLWRDKANYSMRYESFLESPLTVIHEVINALSVADVTADEVSNAVRIMSYESSGDKSEVYHKANLYHKDHITNGRSGSWSDGLAQGLEAEIYERHRNWFVANRYER